MALYKGKKALYEAITTRKSELGQSKNTAKPLRPAAKPEGKTASSGLFRWPQKPKLFQHSGGRVDISLTVPVAVTVGFVALALMLIVFQIGKFVAGTDEPITTSAVSSIETPERTEAARPARPEARTPVTTPSRQQEVQRPSAVASNKTNWIVIQQYQVARDLEPVKEYFAKHGIETKIVSRLSRGRQMFFLVTAEMFENTVRAGSDGYEVLQRIRKLGAGYKAPPQYESFAPHLFGDAYGEKVSQ